MTSTTPTTAELLLEWDATRPRSTQAEFGMSELGDCRRRAGYRLTGTEPTNKGGSVQAVLGTAIHKAVADVLHELQAAGSIPADALIEHEVRFAGILGHLDLYVSPVLTDTKTTSSRWLQKIKVNGPDRSHLWQTHAYGAALISQGRKVRLIAIDYIARDTGEQWRWTSQFDAQHVRDALAWVAEVRGTDLDDLPRDHAPDSAWCQHCPFFDLCWAGGFVGRDPRSVLYAEDPDAAKWVTALDEARQRKTDAAADETKAKGALDALRPNDDDSATVIVPGATKALRWTVTTSHRVDVTQVRRDYAIAGRPVPENQSKTVRLDLVDPEGAS